MSAVSAGDQPSNSAATRAKAATGSEKSMPAIQSSGLFNATYVRSAPLASRCPMIPLPGAIAISVTPPTVSALAL
jgi:hypothetical protein